MSDTSQISQSVELSFELQGKTYTLKSPSEEAEALESAIQRLTSLVKRMEQSTASTPMPADRLLVAVALNILDLLAKTEAERDQLKERAQRMVKEIDDFYSSLNVEENTVET